MTRNLFLEKQYSELTGKTINESLYAYRTSDLSNPRVADLFFSVYGIPNTTPVVNVPFERLRVYEYLLECLKNEDESKFKKMHKGTAYYFLAWFSFDVEDFQKCTYYMDNAIYEDIKTHSGNWVNLPIYTDLTLKTNNGTAERFRNKLTTILQDYLSNYNSIFKQSIDSNNMLEKLVSKLISSNSDEKRSIVSGFYRFIFEVDKNTKILENKPQQNLTIEIFLSSLFLGGLVFESILKTYSNRMGWLHDLDNSFKVKKVQVLVL